MTLVTAGRLVSAGIPSTHFSHVFIDEAGHAMEPESCVALAGQISYKVITFFLYAFNCVLQPQETNATIKVIN